MHHSFKTAASGHSVKSYFSFITKWGFYWQNHCNLLRPIPLKTTSYPWGLQIPLKANQTQFVLIQRRHTLTCTVELISAAKPPVTGASWLTSKRPVFTTDWKTNTHSDDYRRLSDLLLHVFKPAVPLNDVAGIICNTKTRQAVLYEYFKRGLKTVSNWQTG